MTPYCFPCRDCKAGVERPCRDAKGRPCAAHPCRVEAFRVVADEPLPERDDVRPYRRGLTAEQQRADFNAKRNADRADRRDNGMCLSSPSHGEAVASGRCASCNESHKAWQRDAYAKRRECAA